MFIFGFKLSYHRDSIECVCFCAWRFLAWPFKNQVFENVFFKLVWKIHVGPLKGEKIKPCV